MTNFSDLSLDVLLHTFSFLPPRDIILGARQVCLNLNHASVNLSLWKTLLRRICFENTLLSSSFPDNITLKDLEHAATSPSRFISKLHSSCERGAPQLEVYARDYIDIDELMNEEMPNFSETVSQLYLIPGGRFLITQQVSASGSTDEIHLWDLGVPGNAEGIPLGRLPIASLNDRSFLVRQPAHPTRDGKGILVFCCKDNVIEHHSNVNEHHSSGSEGYDELRREIFIYEIYPTLEAPSFLQIATREITFDDGPEPACSFNYSKVAMLVNDVNIYVWDFITNTEATWRASLKVHNRILLQDNSVVLYSSNSVSIFKIPVLYPYGSALAMSRQSLDPCYRLDIDCNPPRNFEQTSVQGLGAWYSGSTQSIYIDSMFRTEGRRFSTTRYRVDISSAMDGDIIESPSSFSPTITIDCILTHDQGSGYIDYEYRVSGDSVILYWNSAQGLTIRCPPLDVSHSSDDSEASQPLLAISRSPRNHRSLVSLCPASGRAVCCDSDRYLIEIVDFLRHPSATSEPLAPYEPSDLDSASDSQELDL